MNKKKFAWLIFMMLFSIIGIIWVQIIWIRNAVEVRNESFDYAVNASLGNAANAIETSRKMDFFNNFLLDRSHLSTIMIRMISPDTSASEALLIRMAVISV